MSVEIYSVCDVTIQVESPDRQQAECIRTLWRQLFVLGDERAPVCARVAYLRFQQNGNGLESWSSRRTVFESDSLRVLRTQTGFGLQCGASFLGVDLARSHGVGALDERFWSRPYQDQREFFLLGLVMLLRGHGLFGLHANGITKDGGGCLIVGGSGEGKTTLTLSLIAAGWRYLCDDALMLRPAPGGIEALAFRCGFSLTRETAERFPERTAVWRRMRDDKRLIDMDIVYPGRSVKRITPRTLLFPRVTGGRESRLVPLDPTQATIALIRRSAGIIVDRPAAQAQLDVLQQLVGQSQSYQLLLGEDVYDNPAAVSAMLRAARQGA